MAFILSILTGEMSIISTLNLVDIFVNVLCIPTIAGYLFIIHVQRFVPLAFKNLTHIYLKWRFNFILFYFILVIQLNQL